VSRTDLREWYDLHERRSEHEVEPDRFRGFVNMEVYGSGWVAIAAVVDDEDESITDAAWFHELPEELFERAYLGR